jgi:hypothetical protein
MLSTCLFRPIKRYGRLSSVGKVVGLFPTSNSVDRVSVYLNLGSSKDCLDIGGVGVCLNSVSSKDG